MQQVLLNLIMNAVDAMAEGDEPRVLCVKSEVHEPDGVWISVADCGTGIHSHDTDRIFNPLFTSKPDGLGMGLSICRAIIEAHEGKLWFAPNKPPGRHSSSSPCPPATCRPLPDQFERTRWSGSTRSSRMPAILTSSANDPARIFFMRLSAMNLQSVFADSEFLGSLLVQETTHDQRKHFELPEESAMQGDRENSINSARFSPSLAVLSPALNRSRAFKFFVLERLGKKVDGSSLDRTHGGRNVAVPRDEHDMRIRLPGIRVFRGIRPWKSSPLMSGSWTSRTRHAGRSRSWDTP